jgi:hypothetical protein
LIVQIVLLRRFYVPRHLLLELWVCNWLILLDLRSVFTIILRWVSGLIIAI